MVHCSQGFAMRIILQWHWIMKSRRSAEFYVGNLFTADKRREEKELYDEEINSGAS